MGAVHFLSCTTFSSFSTASVSTMSLLARSYVKFLQQAKTSSIGQVRNMSAGHDADGWKMWKQCFFFVGIPVIILGHVNAFGMSDGSAHEPPPFVPYGHLRVRTKKFPWGDGNHSLIHNNHLNALPDGYEEHHETVETRQLSLWVGNHLLINKLL